LLSALQLLKKNESTAGLGPVVVLVMDRKELPRYQRFAQQLRQGGIAAEMYLGTSGMKAQMKYADRRGGSSYRSRSSVRTTPPSSWIEENGRSQRGARPSIAALQEAAIPGSTSDAATQRSLATPPACR
jgi:hypothetical protein